MGLLLSPFPKAEPPDRRGRTRPPVGGRVSPRARTLIAGAARHDVEEEAVEGFEGSVVAVFLTAEGGGTPVETPSVNAVAGRGLEGDRYFAGAGTFIKDGAIEPRQEVTLIESEAIEAAGRDYEIRLGLGDSRRNVVTSGVPLNHLIGREFVVGGARLRGLKLCEPCAYLESKTMDGVRKAFAHRGGLRAQILESGTIEKGDAITPA